MVASKRSWAGLVGATFFGATLVLAMGANNPKATVYPRYTLSHNAPFTHIVDNETGRDHVYSNSPGQPSKYLGYIDLSQAGQPELKAVKAEDIKDDKPGK